MQLGLIGLGRMGANMAKRLLKNRHEVIGYDPNAEAGKEIISSGGIKVSSLAKLITKLRQPRAIWIMVPAGDPVTQTIDNLLPHLSPDDTIIDGGNSFYKDSIQRSGMLEEKGINWLDVGTSGGIRGLEVGYCLMIGGVKEAFKRLEPIFHSLAQEKGYLYCGRSGAGHFAKMVHNGIEYGIVQAYGEGFEALNSSSYEFDLESIAHLWNRGSVIRSWLLELAEEAFKKDPKLAAVKGYIEDSGEGRWMVHEAVEQGISVPVMTLSLMERFRSRQKESFSAKVIAALRKEFGGHEVRKTNE